MANKNFWRINIKKKLIILFLCVLFVCEGSAASFRKSRYNFLEKPLDIPYTINNKKMVMHTYLANKKKRFSTFRFRILRYIYDQQFKKYRIELNEDGKNKVNQLWLESFPQKEAYLKYIKFLCSSYEDVYKISLLMKKNKLTPDGAYDQYIKDNKTKLSKRQWKQLFNIASFEWMEKFAKASDNKKMQMIPNHSMILILQIRLLWEKRLFASHYDIKQAASKWQAEVNALSIKVPDEYAAAKAQALKTLRALFPLKYNILNAKTRPAYEELKKLTNNSGLKDSYFSSPKVSAKPKPKVETRKLINWTNKNQSSQNSNVIESNSKRVILF